MTLLIRVKKDESFIVQLGLGFGRNNEGSQDGYLYPIMFIKINFDAARLFDDFLHRFRPSSLGVRRHSANMSLGFRTTPQSNSGNLACYMRQ